MGMNSPGGCRSGSMAEQSLRALQHLLVCPVCKGKLEFSPGLIRCVSCALRFSQLQGLKRDLLVRERQRGQRLRERMQRLNQQLRKIQDSTASVINIDPVVRGKYVSVVAACRSRLAAPL